MTSPDLKLDPALVERLGRLDRDSRISVEIVPIQNRWGGLLLHLRGAAAWGVEYIVVDLTSISATLPRWLIEAVAKRRDVVTVRLQEEE